jgi:hypothetical protein
MNLNSVCLRFEAFVRENGVLQSICSPVYSEPINNMSEFFLLCGMHVWSVFEKSNSGSVFQISKLI